MCYYEMATGLGVSHQPFADFMSPTLSPFTVL